MGEAAAFRTNEGGEHLILSPWYWAAHHGASIVSSRPTAVKAASSRRQKYCRDGGMTRASITSAAHTIA
jgi:hypothetical protein